MKLSRRKFLRLAAAAGAAGALRGPSRAAAGSETLLQSEPLAPPSGPRGATLFRELTSDATGIRTENRYDDPSIWNTRYADFKVGSIGTGVAIGDFDGDGRPDVFVVSKTESCRLFHNLGGWRFEDVTEKAGVGDHGDAARIWKQGATWVDIDNNGRLDLYVCRFGAPNLLYVNQGDGTFREEAAARGLAIDDASVMAAFCDYDRDGHLDVLIQTNAPASAVHAPTQRNYLLRNNGDGTFTDVTARAGLAGKGQGHAAIWWDFDNDGWPDLYVGYDFTPPDRLYRNNRDGTFTEVSSAVLPHIPFSAMGADLGDVDNDGLIDLLVSDMAATTAAKDLRTIANARALLTDPPDDAASPPEYMRNALFLNSGVGPCREAAFLAGLDATDWTWSVRLEDLDNDGRLDLFVTNGMYRDLDDFDLLDRVAAAQTPGAKVAAERNSPLREERHLAFRNHGDLRFEDVSAAWGLDRTGIGFGAAFGDLDGDGDLDLIYTNYRGEVTVLRNDCDRGHRIVVHLRGTRSNRFGVGAVVRIETASGPQVRPLVLARGLMSSSEPMVHFGLGDNERIQRLTVSWPSGCEQVFVDLPADRRYVITEPAAGAPPPPAKAAVTLLTEVSGTIGFDLQSRELALDETAEQPLLPFRQNRRGPAIAVADLDGDGRDEVALGGTFADPLRILGRTGTGPFRAREAPASAGENPLNDGPMLFLDVFGSGRADLLVTRSGVALPAGAPEYQPRLYRNDGHGGLTASPAELLPALPSSIGALAAADFDRDGRLDVFLGGRVVPGQYPLAPRSALWANRGGRFEDVTDQVAPALREIGMVTGALWSDVDGDGWPDLLVTLEWGAVRYFHNDQGRRLEDWTERSGFGAAGTGWWNGIASADFDGDGRPDYAVGNAGLNTPYRASPGEPALLWRGDFNGDGGAQLVEGRWDRGRLRPWRARGELGAVIPGVFERCRTYRQYSEMDLPDIVGREALAGARRFAATELRSGVFLRRSDGAFGFAPLPRIAQIAPTQGLVAADLDGDGCADLCLVQNSFSPVPSIGRFDGGLGQMLRGNGRGGFAPVPPARSGVVVPGDARALALTELDEDGRPGLLVSRSGGRTAAFRNRGGPDRHSIAIRLKGPPGNPTGVGARVVLEQKDGRRQAAEISAGCGHFSQSTPVTFFGWPTGNPPAWLHVDWPGGARTSERFPAGRHRLTVAADGGVRS